MKQYTTAAYKGFAIVHNDATARYHVTTDGSVTPSGDPINADGFRADGYSTLNNAKGAITKYLSTSKAAAATSDDNSRASVPAGAPAPLVSVESEARIAGMVEDMRAMPNGWTTQRNPNGDPIHGNPQMRAAYALLDYMGMSRERDTRSRNKREGKPAERFKWETRHMTAEDKNRKQRKRSKLARREFFRKGA